MRAAGTYAAGVLAAAVLVGVVGGLAVPRARAEVWTGAAVGLVTQVAVFWGLFVLLLPHRRILAHGLGALARLIVLGAAAFALLGASTVASAAMLFALVTVFFMGTLLEPLVPVETSKNR